MAAEACDTRPRSAPVLAAGSVNGHMIDVAEATVDDVPRLAALLGQALADDPLNRHLVPDDARRARVLPDGFSDQLRRVFLPHGSVLTTADRAGAALWLPPPPPPPPPPEPPRGVARVGRVVGPRGAAPPPRAPRAPRRP